mmetsp:Transcript_30116/g.73322  ORF Transcript_30116/g.73322 Transcript_30116/m.73322 type:complete len:246 (+) Transcript_30116:87-824(+)
MEAPAVAHGRLIAPSEDTAIAEEELQYIRDTTWCAYCYCGGCGLTQEGFSDWSCINVKKKLCCLRASTSSKVPLSEGIISAAGKFCCCVNHAQIMPGPNGTPGIVCCGAQLLKWKHAKDEPEAWMRPGHDYVEPWFTQAFWCYYCGCLGAGCTGCGDPLIKGESFLCCVKSEFGTADCTGPDGMCNARGQVCCLITHCRCMPGYTPGIACCGAKLCCSKMPEDNQANGANNVLVAVAPTQQQIVA